MFASAFLLLAADLLHEPFATPTLGPEWNAAKGQWRIVEGRLEGTEIPADKHAAVVRRNVRFHNGTVRYAVRLDGAKAAHLSINGADGHICRLVMTPQDVDLRKDKPTAKSAEKPARLAHAQAVFAPGVWYEVEVAFQGKSMTAKITGGGMDLSLSGEHAGIDQEKTNIGFPVMGATASFDNLRVTGQ